MCFIRLDLCINLFVAFLFVTSLFLTVAGLVLVLFVNVVFGFTVGAGSALHFLLKAFIIWASVTSVNRIWIMGPVIPGVLDISVDVIAGVLVVLVVFIAGAFIEGILVIVVAFIVDVLVVVGAIVTGVLLILVAIVTSVLVILGAIIAGVLVILAVVSCIHALIFFSTFFSGVIVGPIVELIAGVTARVLLWFDGGMPSCSVIGELRIVVIPVLCVLAPGLARKSILGMMVSS